MIGILIAAHQELGLALCRAAEGIVGEMEGVEAISLRYDEAPPEGRRRIEEALRRLDAGEGVLILTDMFGGTPTNMCLPFLEAGRVEVLTGVNLPIVVKAQSARADLGLGELAAFLRDYGARNISLASDLWNARPRRSG
ncbi:MAG: PTS sugar transporter subunit IIA [Deferrisomatales bacterium]|nr:PTS sugar transporter subunit IIA [Deferrisomatales bacterium]